jgi:FtsH-binding integral membrane protein
MTSLIIHALLGLLVVAFTIRTNAAIFRKTTPAVSALEALYYVIGIVSIPLCWYFNHRFVVEYATGSTNPFFGPGSWSEFIELGYDNPASSSASADYTIGNVLLLPLFTIIDGRRRGIRRPWLFFVCSLFTSFSFAWAFYLATVERQRRCTPVLSG